MAGIDVSIIVISYNTKDETLKCLSSIHDQTKEIKYEVIVVDNASADGSPEAIVTEFPRFDLVSLDENIGFGRANNVAAERARGKYLLLLNPDTIVLDGAIQKLYAFAEADGGRGIYGGRSVFPDGSINPVTCRRRETVWSMTSLALGLPHLFKGSSFFNPETYGSFRQDRVKEVDIVSGCFFLIERELFESLHGFDPVFFMYGEEVDLCIRAKKSGRHCLFTPDATIIHYGGASEKVFADKMVKLLSAQATNIRRHWPSHRSWLGLALLELWILRRWIQSSVMALFSSGEARQKAKEFKKVWNLRSRWIEGFERDEQKRILEITAGVS